MTCPQRCVSSALPDALDWDALDWGSSPDLPSAGRLEPRVTLLSEGPSVVPVPDLGFHTDPFHAFSPDPAHLPLKPSVVFTTKKNVVSVWFSNLFFFLAVGI